MRSTATTLADLRGENALVIVGSVARLLERLEREVADLKGLSAMYRAEALSGSYESLCEVTEVYAIKFLASTLRASEGDLTGVDDDEDDGYDEEDF